MLYETMNFISELIRTSLSLFTLCALDIVTKNYSLFFIIPREREREKEKPTLMCFLQLTCNVHPPNPAHVHMGVVRTISIILI